MVVRFIQAVLSRLVVALATPVWAAERAVVLSTSFVLERKFTLLAETAHQIGLDLQWAQVDKISEDELRKILDGAKVVLVDAPRREDSALVQRTAGALLATARLPVANINLMSPPTRLVAVNLEARIAQRIFDYYVAGTRTNHERLVQFLKALVHGEDALATKPAMQLPNGGIYHPTYEDSVFASLPEYISWWEAHTGHKREGRMTIGVEMSSSYISDGQTRMLDETISAIEARDAFPLMFYRASRAERAAADRPTGATGSGTNSQANAGGARPSAPAGSGRPPIQPPPEGFPNPKPSRAVEVAEPLVTVDGKILPDVLMVNTFLGIDPEGRKAWHTAMDIPVLNVLAYRSGNRKEYAQDNAGVSSFLLPYTLTQGDYIGLQDPVMLVTNEDGELTPLPEQMDLLVGKAINLAKLRNSPNESKRLSLLFWNHPPGEKNQGASNLNVPRSISLLIERLRSEGYSIEPADEQSIIAATADNRGGHPWQVWTTGSFENGTLAGGACARSGAGSFARMAEGHCGLHCRIECNCRSSSTCWRH